LVWREPANALEDADVLFLLGLARLQVTRSISTQFVTRTTTVTTSNKEGSEVVV
jgi:hypothetical protein